MAQAQMAPGVNSLDYEVVYYEGSDTIKTGYALCYNSDYGTAASADGSRGSRVEKPAAGNLRRFAGVVAPGLPSDGVAGPRMFRVIKPNGVLCNAFVNESTTLGTTRLTVQPGSYYLGGIGEGLIVAEAAQTVDRSTTAGLCQVKLFGVGESTSPIITTSSALWDTCPLHEISHDPGLGFVYFDDFITLSDEYTATQATTGTWALDDAVGGVVLADSAGTAEHQGINVQLNTGTGEIFKPAATKDIWFEARIKIADCDNGPELMIGLANIDTTAIATSAVSTTDHIAFTSVTSDKVVLFNGEKAGTGNTETFATLVDGTWARLGFHVTGVTTAQAYLNGVATGTALVTANIPILEMVPTFVCQVGATVEDTILHIDWVKCVQLR